jgi:hypothetical protein
MRHGVKLEVLLAVTFEIIPGGSGNPVVNAAFPLVCSKKSP